MSTFDNMNRHLAELAYAGDFIGLRSFLVAIMGLDSPIISKSQDGVIVIDSKTGKDIVFIPFKPKP